MPDTGQATLHEVVEALAPLARRAGSEAEKQAAHWIADRFERSGIPVGIEEEEFLDGYAKLLLPLGVAGLVAGALGLRGRRLLPAVLGSAVAALQVDDVSNGPRIWRKLFGARKRTWNVVARAGDERAGRTLVVLAHHDAAPTGRVFDQSFQRWLARRFPELIARSNTSMPVWWPVVGGPLLTAVAGISGRRALAAAGSGLSALSVALGFDIARNRIVPGASDNLSGVAALVALGERLRPEPLSGLRVLLSSCGAEEVLQGGIYGFAARHFAGLERNRTWVLNLDTLGSEELIMLEGEGCFVMEEYPGPEFRDLIAEAAADEGLALYRGVRSRASTDSVIPSRAGYPTATLASWEPDCKLPSNYHLMSDTPQNVHYETVERAVTLAHATARALADGAA